MCICFVFRTASFEFHSILVLAIPLLRLSMGLAIIFVYRIVRLLRPPAHPTHPRADTPSLIPFFVGLFMFDLRFQPLSDNRWKTKRDSEATIVLKMFLTDVKR